MSNPLCWQIELEGSELARIDLLDSAMVIVLAAARVPGDKRQRGSGRQDGHLHGVRLHLVHPRWEGPLAAMIGRIDEASWTCLHTSATTGPRGTLSAPSSGTTPICLSLRTALGETLVVHCESWRVEVSAHWRWTPSLAC